MSEVRTTPPGDRVTVSVQVAVPTDIAFRMFTEDINLWWRRGLPYRVGGVGGVLHFEPYLGGRLYETIESEPEARIVETGRVTAWEPPRRLAFEWRAINFGPGDRTMVEVTFEPRGRGTLLTLRHSGWSDIPLDHPVRHGQEVAAFMRSMGMWWGDLMTGLREHLSKTA